MVVVMPKVNLIRSQMMRINKMRSLKKKIQNNKLMKKKFNHPKEKVLLSKISMILRGLKLRYSRNSMQTELFPAKRNLKKAVAHNTDKGDPPTNIKSQQKKSISYPKCL